MDGEQTARTDQRAVAGNGVGRRRRIARAVAVVAATSYVVLLGIGLVSSPRSFGWESVSCPVLAGPAGTASAIQHLRFGPALCTDGDGARRATLAGLALLAGVAGAAVLAHRHTNHDPTSPNRSRAGAVVVAIAAVAVVAPFSTLSAWPPRDHTTVGPQNATGMVAADQRVCVAFAGGTWISSGRVDGHDANALIEGTLRLESAGVGTFTEDGPNGATIEVSGGWPDDPRLDVSCAIS